MNKPNLIGIGFLLGIFTTFMLMFVFGPCSFEFYQPGDSSKETNANRTKPKLGGHKKSVKVGEQEIVILRNEKGVAAIQFQDFAGKNQASKYRWRFLSAENDLESEGEDIVYEKYSAEMTKPNNYRLEDQGSRLMVQAGKIAVEWSYASEDSGWIYLVDGLVHEQEEKAGTLNEVNLKEHLSNKATQRTLNP